MQRCLATLLIMVSFVCAVQGGRRTTFALGVSLEETAIPLLREKISLYRTLAIELRQGIVHLRDTEAVYQETIEDAFLIGVRTLYDVTRFLPAITQVSLYSGIEYDFVTAHQFGAEHPLATGRIIGLFVGAEKYLSDGLSLCLDAGVYHTSLSSPHLDFREEGVDLLFNILVNFYLF
jgi:hypothetical protein